MHVSIACATWSRIVIGLIKVAWVWLRWQHVKMFLVNSSPQVQWLLIKFSDDWIRQTCMQAAVCRFITSIGEQGGKEWCSNVCLDTWTKHVWLFVIPRLNILLAFHRRFKYSGSYLWRSHEVETKTTDFWFLKTSTSNNKWYPGQAALPPSTRPSKTLILNWSLCCKHWGQIEFIEPTTHL